MPLRIAAIALLATLTACASTPPTFEAPLERTHPLVGKVWEPAAKRFLEPADLPARAASADVVLLGETHDNRDHHALQAWIVRSLAEAGHKPVVAFEMISSGQRADLDKHLADNPGDARGIGAAIGWEKSGWPDWSLYRPIAEAALDAGSTIKAANLSRQDTRALGRGEAPELAALLGVDKPLEPSMQSEMEGEIKESHCGMLPDIAVPPMVTVQRARDAVMANALAEVIEKGQKAVLIAGTGHVRADRGVPWHLRMVAPEARVLAVAFVEVQPGTADPAAYGEAYGARGLPFDVVMFTPRSERTDQCEEFRKHMEKRRRINLNLRLTDDDTPTLIL